MEVDGAHARERGVVAVGADPDHLAVERDVLAHFDPGRQTFIYARLLIASCCCCCGSERRRGLVVVVVVLVLCAEVVSLG